MWNIQRWFGNRKCPEMANSEALDIQMVQPISRRTLGERGQGGGTSDTHDNSTFSVIPAQCVFSVEN